MKVVITTHHNSVCFFHGLKLGDGDSLEIASRNRPIAFEAARRFRSEWENKNLDQYGMGELHVSIFLDHCGGHFTNKKQKLAKTKLGYSAAIVMFQSDLMKGGEERSSDDILSYLDMSMSEILGRPALVKFKNS